MNKKTFCVPEKRQFCRYIVIDMEYGFVLSAGERYKNLLNLQYVSDFRSGFLFRRKLKEYISVKAVKGRKCIIVFWAGASERIPWNVVFSSGCFLGIRGGYKKTNSKFKKSKKYVHHIETSISKFLL